MTTFGSVCDGIGCGHLAFVNAGFECVWSAEIEPFPCAVLEHRFPGVPNHGDMNLTASLIERGEIAAPDVFIGGTPCQAFSVAGKRKGLDDARGNLSLTFCGIADAIDDVRRRDGKPPCVVLWENVPVVLSDNGNAFGCFLGELAGSGCELQPAGERWSNAGCVFGPRRTVAWRTLDSQFFGVAQRRRRVFVVASAGDGCRPDEVLFEREGVRRDSPPCRESRGGVAGDAGERASTGSLCARTGQSRSVQDAEQGHLIGVCTFDRQSSGEYSSSPLASTVSERDYKSATDPIAIQDVRGLDKKQNGRGYNADGSAYTVDAMATQGVAVAFQPRYFTRDNKTGGVDSCGDVSAALSSQHAGGDSAPCVAFDTYNQSTDDVTQTLRGTFGDALPAVHQGSSVRRLTPVECERLQALPDNWTQIPWRGKPASECPDGPRYKGVGNGQTVSVMEWLARRIKTAIEHAERGYLRTRNTQ